MNPFLSVWLHPKQTARYVIEHKTIVYALILFIIGYIASGFSGLMGTELYPDLSYVWLFLIVIIITPIFGILMMFLTTGITFLVGKLLKGSGSFWDIFKACSLGSIPTIITGPLYLLWMFVSPESFFNTNEIGAFAFIMTIILIVNFIWSIVIVVATVAEAHQFSIIRSFITLFIPAILLFILIFGIIAIISIIIVVIFSSI